MLIEVLRELDARWKYEHLELIVDAPWCLLHDYVLISCANLDHGVSTPNEGLRLLVSCALQHSAVSLSVSEVLNQDLVNVNINLAVSVPVYQMCARDTLDINTREHLVIL